MWLVVHSSWAHLLLAISSLPYLIACKVLDIRCNPALMNEIQAPNMTTHKSLPTKIVASNFPSFLAVYGFSPYHPQGPQHTLIGTAKNRVSLAEWAARALQGLWNEREILKVNLTVLRRSRWPKIEVGIGSTIPITSHTQCLERGNRSR
jgi:hypothetical protein